MLAALALLVTPTLAQACPSLLDHRYMSLQGKPVNLCDFAGRPILVVNTASKCGYTPQFEKLEALHKRYQGRGLVVLGLPSNDFNQELATNREIAEFCKLTYFVEFPMVEQGSVTGPGANGKTVHSFGTRVEPDSREIMGKLVPMLK
jgi:glutathione peroxidase